MPAIPDYNRKGGYAGWEFISRPEYDWSGRTVVGQCFSQEKPDTVVFRPGTIGMRLVNCNIDNCLIPPGNSVQGECSQRRFFIQNDLRDWEVDAQDKPTKVLNEKHWVLLGKSVDPVDIPVDFLRREQRIQAEFLAIKDTPEFQSWFDEEPSIIDSNTETVTEDVSIERYQEMLDTSDFAPFDMRPNAEQIFLKDKEIMRLRGPVTRVTIEGRGKFSGGIGFQPFVNSPYTDIVDADSAEFVIEGK